MQNLPYEKFITYGSRALTDSELLAILLRTGTRGISACALGEEVLTRTACFGNGLSGLYHIPLEELKKIDGIGEVKAIQLKTIAELSTRMAQAKAKDGLSFRRPCSVAEYYMERFRHETVEYIVLLLVDSGRAYLVQGDCQCVFDFAQRSLYLCAAEAGGRCHAAAQSSRRQSGSQ